MDKLLENSTISAIKKNFKPVKALEFNLTGCTTRPSSQLEGTLVDWG